MLSFYNFVFQRLTWKKIRVPYGLIIYFSRNEKLQKYRIILSKHTNYLHKWLVSFLTFLLLPCFFFFNEIPKYVQAKNRLAHLDWHFVEWASMLTKLAGYDEYKLIQFYKLIFLRIQFSLVATFFFLVLIICLSWYLDLTLPHEFLTFGD